MSSIWEGSRVRLRAVEPSDWEVFYTWHLDSDSARSGYEIGFPQSEQATQRWAERLSVTTPENDEFRWVIERPDGEMVGTINTHSCDRRNGTFSYGVIISREHRGQGYASEAVRMVLRYCFGELRYQKATAHIYDFNVPSAKLHERLGFKLEGCIRRMIYTDGEYFDDLIYGITAEEFAGRDAPERDERG